MPKSRSKRKNRKKVKYTKTLSLYEKLMNLLKKSKQNTISIDEIEAPQGDEKIDEKI